MDARGSVKKQGQEALLAWCQEKTRKHPQWIAQEVQDFGRSWHDGLAFTVLLCSIAPSVSRDFDLEPCLALSRSDPKKLLAKVFGAAKGLGIAALLEPEDLIGETAEASSETVIMYLSQFYRFEQAKIQEQKHKSTTRESIRFTKPEPAPSSSSSSHSRATASSSGVFVGPGDESQRPKCVIWYALLLSSPFISFIIIPEHFIPFSFSFFSSRHNPNKKKKCQASGRKHHRVRKGRVPQGMLLLLQVQCSHHWSMHKHPGKTPLHCLWKRKL